jgi:hypothetical protein
MNQQAAGMGQALTSDIERVADERVVAQEVDEEAGQVAVRGYRHRQLPVHEAAIHVQHAREENGPAPSSRTGTVREHPGVRRLCRKGGPLLDDEPVFLFSIGSEDAHCTAVRITIATKGARVSYGG